MRTNRKKSVYLFPLLMWKVWPNDDIMIYCKQVLKFHPKYTFLPPSQSVFSIDSYLLKRSTKFSLQAEEINGTIRGSKILMRQVYLYVTYMFYAMTFLHK